MKIEILGTGCPKCKKVYENAKAAIKEIGRDDIEVTKIEKITEITARGVMMTPALAMDGTIKSSGKIPSISEIVGWING